MYTRSWLFKEIIFCNEGKRVQCNWKLIYLIWPSILVAFLLWGASARAQTIDTVIGGGVSVNSSEFALINPAAAVTDSKGNLFVSTGRLDQAVRKLDISTGMVSLVAGAAGPTYGGDGGPASRASLNSPSRMVYDAAGNLYIADSGNNRVRMIDTQGNISTFAGPLVPGAPTQPTVAVSLESPVTLYIDKAGNLFIGGSDVNGPKVIKIATDKSVTTVASKSQSPEMESIMDIVVDASGNLYVADMFNYCVHRFDAVSQTRTTFAGICGSYNSDKGSAVLQVDNTQLATNVKLSMPRSLTMDGAGNLYLADSRLYRIWKINPDTAQMAIFAGAGNSLPDNGWMPYEGEFSGDGNVALGARFKTITYITYDIQHNELFVVDANNNRVRKIGADNVINTVLGSGASSNTVPASIPGTQAQLNNPTGLAFDSAGNLYISDTSNGWVRMLAASPITQLVDAANNVTKVVQMTSPTALGFDLSDTLFAGDQSKNQVFKVLKGASNNSVFAGNGNLGSSGDGSAAPLATLRNPQGIAVDKNGNVFFSDWQNHTIRKVNAAGIISTVVGLGWTGGFVDGVGSDARLVFPVGLAFDKHGNLYIADSVNHRVRKVLLGNDSEISASSTVTTVAGNGTNAFTGDNGLATSASLYWPNSVAVDSADNIYIMDSGNARVRMVSGATGIISTIAGGGANGLGDGGLALDAQFMNLQHGVLDKQGNLFVSDLATGRIRKITFSAPDAPTGTAEAGDGMATVRFTAPLNMGGGSATRFTVYYADLAHTTPVQGCEVAAFDTSGNSVSSCDIPGLNNGTPYTFTVAVTNSLGKTSSLSANIGPITPFGVAHAPTSVTADAGDAQVTVSWTAPANTGGSAITSYTVKAYAPGTISPVLAQCATAPVTPSTAAPTSCIVTGLANGTPYVFAVVATNARGDSAQSAPSASATPLPGLALTPTATASAKVGQAFSLPLPASGGTGSYSFALQSGTLPAGLGLNGASITGTPTSATATAVSITVRLTDTGNGNTKDATIAITVAKGSQTIQFTSAIPTGAKVGGSHTVTATGGHRATQ